jgi:hypothetical protein
MIGAFLDVGTSTQCMLSAREWAWVRWFMSSLPHPLDLGTRYRVQLHNDGSERASTFKYRVLGQESEFESVLVMRGEKRLVLLWFRSFRLGFAGFFSSKETLFRGIFLLLELSLLRINLRRIGLLNFLDPTVCHFN